MEEIGFSAQEVEALEREFQEILNELAGDQTLEKFKIEYHRLYQAFRNSYDNEKKLLKKLRDVNNDIQNNAAKVSNALKYSQDDTQTIQYLKTELERTFKVLEGSKQREDTLKAKIESLTAELRHLNSLVEQGNALASQTSKIQELQQLKDDLSRERDQLAQEMIRLRSETGGLIERLKQLENERLIQDQNLIQLRKNHQEMKTKSSKDDSRRKKINDELSKLQANYEASKKDFEKYSVERDKIKDELEKLINNGKKLDEEKDEEVKKRQAVTKQLLEVKKEYEELQLLKEQLEQEREELDHNVIVLKAERNNLKTTLNQMQKQNDKLNNKLLVLDKNNAEMLKDKEVAINSIQQLERHVHDTRKLNEEDQQLLEELRKAHENFMKHLAKAELQHGHLQDQINGLNTNIVAIEDQIQKRQEEVDLREKDIKKLKKKKEKFGKDAALINAKFLHSQEEIKLKDNLISEFQKKNIETESKLRQQQHLYEEVRSDRNLYSKLLLETEDEIAVIKRRHRIVSHQIAQLKEEIDAKEVALAKEHFEHKKKDKTIEEQSRILEKNRKEIEKKEEDIKNHVGEISKLHCVIRDSENKRQKLKEEYELVVSERDILGTQLIRRNDESALLYEKIKVQQDTLAKGEQQYRERLCDIELLKYKISDLQRELRLNKQKAGQIPTMKININDLQQELINEKLRVKALSEELENPLNPQRCKKLQGSDPDVYEMKQKIKTLQRRLIFKTEQVVEKEVLIQQKEKQILELREIMRKQPGLDEAIQISKLQEQMKGKTRQMKSLAAELNMYQAQINEYKYEIERLNKELQETKRQYLEQRKREQIQQEQAQLAEQNQQQQG